MPEQRYKPGDLVPVTGWYHVIHTHDAPSETLLKEDAVFPSCPQCKISPTYTLSAIVEDEE